MDLPRDNPLVSVEVIRNTIELPVGNNMVPLRFDTIRLVQNECSFHGLRSEDPNQHLKDFLKLVDSLNLNGKNRERTIHHHMGGSYYPIPCLILSTMKDRKTPQRHPDVPTTSWRISIRSINSLQGLTPEKNPEQAFVDYASSRTDEAEGLVSEFMASQDARLSKFEADFKQQQSEMTNKIDTVLKAITDQIAGTLPSDTVKNPKLGATPILSARSYLKIDPQCSSYTSNSINAIKAHFKKATISQTSLQQPEMETEPPQPKDPEPTPEDEFQDLHLNLLVLKVLAYALIYNAILDKYIESLELGKIGSLFVQGEIPAKIEDPGIFTLPCRLGGSKPFDTLADLGSCVNIIPLYLFKKLNIGLLDETNNIFGLANGTKSYPVGIVKDVEVHIGKLKLLNEFYVIDMKKDPETPLLVGRCNTPISRYLDRVTSRYLDSGHGSGCHVISQESRRGFLAIANAVIDCRMAKIAVREGIVRSVFSVKGVDLGEEEVPYWTTLGKRESYKRRPRSEGVGAQTPYYARKDFLDCHLPGE
nr:hypothetical protein [Tanacetum cinerariifolium]